MWLLYAFHLFSTASLFLNHKDHRWLFRAIIMQNMGFSSQNSHLCEASFCPSESVVACQVCNPLMVAEGNSQYNHFNETPFSCIQVFVYYIFSWKIWSYQSQHCDLGTQLEWVSLDWIIPVELRILGISRSSQPVTLSQSDLFEATFSTLPTEVLFIFARIISVEACL